MMVTCFSDVLSILLILSTSLILTSQAAGQCSNKFPTGGLAFVAKVAERVTNNEKELRNSMFCFGGFTCIQSCNGMADGDYQSCIGCQVYATCSNEILYDNRPCAPDNTYWDDRVKQCIYRSTTCRLLTFSGDVTGTTCIRSCDGMADGDYQSCLGCQVYATCSNEILSDNRPCAELNTYWDDRVKQCIYRSTTCPPRRSEVCQLQADPGMCMAYMPMYYYHHDTRRCESFIYGGCHGNGNRFKTYVECATTCMKHPQDPPRGDVCRLQKVVGFCKMAVPRFYFDIITQQCESFIYGGCNGNDNNFETEKGCETTCEMERQAPTISEVCQLEKDPGFCYGQFPRFYYNNDTMQCQSFNYGGCQGNGNNFKTIEGCETTCTKDPPGAV